MFARLETEKFKSDIENAHFSLTSSELDDFVKICCLLTNKTLIIQQLIKLEELLRIDAKLKGIFDSEELTNTLFNINDPCRYKILSDTLRRWACENNAGQSFAKIQRLLSPATFHSLLTKGTLFKDVGVPFEHGAWTHFLQWFIIFEANKEHLFFENDPKKLYKLLSSLGRQKNKTISLWFLCCDQNNFKDKNDFRTPDNLHMLIKKDEGAYFLLLSTIIKKGFKQVLSLHGNVNDVEYRDALENNKRLVMMR